MTTEQADAKRIELNKQLAFDKECADASQAELDGIKRNIAELEQTRNQIYREASAAKAQVASTEEKIKLLDHGIGFDESTVTTAYTGREGCRCGCGGKYIEDKKSIKRLIANAEKAIAAGAVVEREEQGVYVNVDAGPTRQWCFYFDER